jgi:Tfp pilus assembly protein PilX
MGMKKDILKDQEGAVLVLVLIVLVAAIIMGVMIIRSSVLEAKMAGNERRYIQNFADLESAAAMALVSSTEALASVATSIGNTFTYDAGDVQNFLPDNNSNIRLMVTLSQMKKPPKGSGNDPSLQARYYTIQASEISGGNQSLTVGAYKVFPQQAISK